jgi:PAS domain S-box-containing protein
MALTLRISVVVAVVEATIILAFSIVPSSVQLRLDEYPLSFIVLDIIILTSVCSPIIYLWVIRPFVVARIDAESLLLQRDSEQRYGSLFTNLPLGVMVEDYSAVKDTVDQLLAEGIEDLKTYLSNNPKLLQELVTEIRTVDANQAFFELYRCSSLQQLADELADFSHWWNDEWLEYYASEIASFSSHNKHHDVEMFDTRIDDSKFEARIISTVVEGHEDTWKRVLTIHEDISVRYQREEILLDNQSLLERLVQERTSKLIESEQHFRTLVDTANAPIFGIDAQGKINEWNQQAEKITGFNKKEVMGRVLVTDFITDDYKASVGEIMKKALKGEETANFEFPLFSKSGDRVDVLSSSTIRRDASGQIVGVVGVGQDITELNKLRVEQERERKEAAAKIIQSSKLATLGEMATSVAHELNQPLNVIRMAAGNSRRKIAKGIDTPEYLNDKLERIEAQTARAAAIIDHMRMFGREAKEHPEPIDPRNVVTNALDLMGEQLRLAGIEIVTELPEDCPSILGHTIQMEQVILNLLSNARDAMAERDVASKITLRVFEDDEEVHITSEDTGGGIPEDILSRVFEPFYTTKKMGQGTGLGLSVSYGIVCDMNGTIAAKNIENGAQFTITLPIVHS